MNDLSNIGVLKNHIRKQIIPIDDIDAFKKYLTQLSGPDRNSLMITIIEFDAIRCFKLIHSQFKQSYYNYLVKFAPLQICLFLKDDLELFHKMIFSHPGNKNLVEYFCQVVYYASHPTVYWSRFRNHGNDIPAALISVIHLKNYRESDLVWKYLSHSQRLEADPERTEKEDWLELMNFPWRGFVKIHTYPLYDILLYAYPENTWLLRWNAPFIVGYIQKNVLKMIKTD